MTMIRDFEKRIIEVTAELEALGTDNSHYVVASGATDDRRHGVCYLAAVPDRRQAGNDLLPQARDALHQGRR